MRVPFRLPPDHGLIGRSDHRRLGARHVAGHPPGRYHIGPERLRGDRGVLRGAVLLAARVLFRAATQADLAAAAALAAQLREAMAEARDEERLSTHANARNMSESGCDSGKPSRPRLSSLRRSL